MNKIVIRTATPADAPALLKLSRKTFIDAFSHMNSKEDFDAYVADAFTLDRISAEILDSNNTFFNTIACPVLKDLTSSKV